MAPIFFGRDKALARFSQRRFVPPYDQRRWDVFAIVAPPGVIGARQAGAGFGGCMVALVDTACSDAFRAAVMDAYRSVTNVMPEIYPVEAAAGAEVLVGK